LAACSGTEKIKSPRLRIGGNPKDPVRGQIERQPLPSVALIFADQNIAFALLIMVRRASTRDRNLLSPV
jgi:hypothetical protein